MESATVDMSAHINKARGAGRLCRRVRDAARGAGPTRGSRVEAAAALQVLMRLPDVVSTDAEEVSEEEITALMACCGEAAAV